MVMRIIKVSIFSLMEVRTRTKFDELQQTTFDFGRRIVDRTSSDSGSVDNFYSTVDGFPFPINNNDLLVSMNGDLDDLSSSGVLVIVDDNNNLQWAQRSLTTTTVVGSIDGDRRNNSFAFVGVGSVVLNGVVDGSSVGGGRGGDGKGGRGRR